MFLYSINKFTDYVNNNRCMQTMHTCKKTTKNNFGEIALWSSFILPGFSWLPE